MKFNAYSETETSLMGVTVKSAGHIFAKNGRSINRPNGREDFLLFYTAKGSETFSLDKETECGEGSFIVFRPGERQVHTYRGSKTAEFYYVHFTAPSDFDLFGFESSRVYPCEPSEAVSDIFEELINELLMKAPRFEKLSVTLLFKILLTLSRRAEAENVPKGQYDGKIAYVLQVMKREYGRNYTLDDYAGMCSMSRYHFLRVFESLTGVTPIEYRNGIRLEHAKSLLSDTPLSVCEIAERVGYTSAVYFCDAFKKKTGTSPSKFRKAGK